MLLNCIISPSPTNTRSHTQENQYYIKMSQQKKGTKFSLLCFLCVCEWAGRGRFWKIFLKQCGREPGFRLPFVCTLHACTSVLALSDRCCHSWMWRSVHAGERSYVGLTTFLAYTCGNISLCITLACDAKADISSGLSSNFPSPP